MIEYYNVIISEHYSLVIFEYYNVTISEHYSHAIFEKYNVIILEYCNIRYYVKYTKTTKYKFVSNMYDNLSILKFVKFKFMKFSAVKI